MATTGGLGAGLGATTGAFATALAATGAFATTASGLGAGTRRLETVGVDDLATFFAGGVVSAFFTILRETLGTNSTLGSGVGAGVAFFTSEGVVLVGVELATGRRLLRVTESGAGRLLEVDGVLPELTFRGVVVANGARVVDDGVGTLERDRAFRAGGVGTLDRV